MQLPNTQRREVIEDILDIRIFSIMNSLLKEKVSETKDAISKIETEIANAKTKVEAQTAIIKTISDAKADNIKSFEAKILSSTEEISRTQSEIDVIIGEIGTLKNQTEDKDKITEDLEKAKSIKSKLLQKIETCEHHTEFFSEHDVCPSCDQNIPDQHKSKIIETLNEKLLEQNGKVGELENILASLNERLSAIVEIQSKITDKNIELSTRNSTITLLNKQVKEIQAEIQSTKTDTTNIDEEKAKLKELAKEALGKINQKTALSEQRNLEEVANILLKDTGIKTAIIREYLPIMNKLINKYLNAMDAYIHFELDEAFNESVKSRFRDDFTYASFSEGEKQKIDLAILFTWRQIAKLKNSVNTNLLIMDEIFDSSLDAQGTELLLALLAQVTHDTNVFIISHKGDQLFDKFRSVIKFEKHNDFSIIAKS
jgi:DNA repair exonuclease SbcCD ATPase subunit